LIGQEEYGIVFLKRDIQTVDSIHYVSRPLHG